MYKSIKNYTIMSEENISQEFRLKNIDETRTYFIKEINQNELMSKKHKKVCRLLIILNTYLFQFLQLLCAFPFLFLLFQIGITSSAIGLRFCAIAARIEKYKSIIKKKKKKHDKVALLAKLNLNSIEILISRALIDSNISHDEFF